MIKVDYKVRYYFFDGFSNIVTLFIINVGNVKNVGNVVPA